LPNILGVHFKDSVTYFMDGPLSSLETVMQTII